MNFPAPSPESLQILAAAGTILTFAAARRTERLYERVQDLNRERLQVLEKSLEMVPIRSRLEGLSMQLDLSVQSSISARRLTLLLLALQWGMSLVACIFLSVARRPLPLTAFAVAWTLALGLSSGWMWLALTRAARTAEESTAHSGRHEFLFVSSIRRTKG